MTKTNSILLKLGTIQTILMGFYHFFIPFQYNWENYLNDSSPTINWSLFSINNCFSFNLLLVAIALGYYLFVKPDKKEVIKVLTSLIFLFWMFSTVYQLIDPMPLPAHLNWIGFILIGVAFINTIIFLIPLVSLIKKE